MRALERAKAKAHAPPEGGVVLVVSHGGIMRLWLNEVTSTRVPLIGNGAAYAVDFDEHGVRAALWSG
jgi:broad specificity phosphatase PhoE